MSQLLTQVTYVRHSVNGAIADYLSGQSPSQMPGMVEQINGRARNGAKLLSRLAQMLPEPVELAHCEYPVLVASNGVIFASAGCKDLLQLRLRRPFPEVYMTVGVLPAKEIGQDWCYCNPRGEPEANLEAWIRMAYEYAMAGDESVERPHRVVWPAGH
jgi:hypothetical protein